MGWNSFLKELCACVCTSHLRVPSCYALLLLPFHCTVMQLNEYRGGLGQLRNSEERRVLLQSGTG